ncbi:helix-turn-helix domain-containing protein [Haladaptatus sp. YSMS36]|uniref:MarR family transcriptional regulator n=1 Tax=Haladaptatus sp. YSMS36 TaxID=3033384 RepID=UPI0023E7C519|nr:helix-turn-helix domain-containing protein [Haladaptatus sp. YSMS36]
MPVHLESHVPELNLKPGTTKSDIVQFLYENPEWGYTPKDVTDELDIPRGTATTTLKRLYDTDYVGKTSDGYYHALSDRTDIQRYLSNLDQLYRMFGHHRSDTTPEEPTRKIGEGRTDEDLDAELAELEANLE